MNGWLGLWLNCVALLLSVSALAFRVSLTNERISNLELKLQEVENELR